MSPGPHLLGRVAPPDQRHLALHPYAAGPPPASVEVTITRPTLDTYDQGSTPQCVGYAASKVMNHFNRYAFDAHWLYQQCKLVDGDPNGDGTNARAACDVLRAKGHWRKINGKLVKAGPKLAHGISSNTWASTVDEIRSVFARATPEPVLIGIDWLNAWFNPQLRGKDYWLQAPDTAGGVAGGHEIAVFACSDQRQAFGLSNTWGASWPNPTKRDSLVWLPYSTMTWLFGHGADACVIQDLASR